MQKVIMSLILFSAVMPLDAEFFLLKYGSIVKDAIRTKNSTLDPPLDANGKTYKSGDVLLSWRAPKLPGLPIAHYRVCNMKNNRTVIIGEVKENKVLLKAPIEREKIFIAAVDREGEESEYRKVRITEYKPPRPPTEVILTMLESGNMYASWTAPDECYWPVEKYRIRKISRDGKAEDREVKENILKMKGPKDFEKILVAAVDGEGGVSGYVEATTQEDDSVTRAKAAGVHRVRISPVVLYPMGALGSMGGVGYGGMLSFMMNDFVVNGVTAGLEAGFMFIPGKDSLTAEGPNFHRINFIPVLVKIGYLLRVSRYFSITPFVSFGAAYVFMPDTSRDWSTAKITGKVSGGIDPMGMLSLSFDYAVGDFFFVGISAGYGTLFEKERLLKFAQGGISFGMRF